jgi:hypothetical protein
MCIRGLPGWSVTAIVIERHSRICRVAFGLYAV